MVGAAGSGASGLPPRVPRVCALGQLRLRYDEHDVPVLGKPARVLGGLLAKRDGISLEELVEVVWPVAPPKTAKPALHVHLGTLRRLFADAPPGASIIRAGDRYRLDLDGWEVDLDVVEEITSAAYVVATSDPATASRLFREALAMWCGPALLVDGEAISPPLSSRFELARLDAEEAWVESMLAVGEFRQAEALAAEMAAASPYRERRWGQLMRSQAASGRTVDALKTFRRARQRLVGDLGVEPGPELRSLEASILAREQPRAHRPEDLDPPPRPSVPLIGRRRLVERIETALGGCAPVVVVGAPGVGKTRVALEVAQRAVEARRQVGWVDLRNAAFGGPDAAERIAIWARSWPGGLVVLDNAETAAEVLEQILDQIGRAARDVQVLITSRVPIRSVSSVVALPALELPTTDDPDDIEASESVRLLRASLGVLAPNTAVTSAVAASVCRHVGGLPLGIEFAAELARSIPPTEVARIVGSRLESKLEAAMTAVLGRLDDADRAGLERVSVVAGNVDIRLLRALLDQPDDEMIGRLVEFGVVQFDPSRPSGPYSVLEPMRDLLSTLISDPERLAALERLVDHCVERSRHGPLPPILNDEGETLRAELARELPWHRQAIRHLAEREDDERALSIAANLELPLYGLGWWTTNVELQDAALAIPGPPSALRARVHSARGRPGLLHRFDVGHLMAAIDMAERVGDAATAAKATYQLGIRRWWEGRWDEALRLLDQARRDAQACGDSFVVVEAERFGGVVLVSAGEVEPGLAAQIEVLERVERSRHNDLLVPHVRMYLGHCRRHVGDDDAVVDLEAARAGFERVGNTASLIHVCAGLAELYTDQGRSELALGRAAQALRTAAEGKITTYDPWVLCTIARVHAADGDVDSSLAAIDRAVASLAHNWVGEVHRVAVELAATTASLGEFEAAARLIGVADANEDRRELPFRTPLEGARLARAAGAAVSALGEGYEHLRRRGATSTVEQALGSIALRSRDTEYSR